MTTKREREVRSNRWNEEYYKRLALDIAQQQGFDLEVEGHESHKVTDEGRELIASFHHPWYKAWYSLKFGG